ncbi:MAG TPA: S1/P1 nuclease [Holophaga sp.]|nr:S1/P1 nuclease [Holophaga sp.]
MFRSILVPTLVALLPAQALAWGSLGHRTVAVTAVRDLPPGPGAWFRQAEDFMADHAMDPDRWKRQDPLEGPRHYLDCEYYGGPGRVPRDRAAAQAALGLEKFSLAGQVPWTVLQFTERVEAAFRAGDRDLAVLESAHLSHYVGDLSVPLHTTANHNGEATGQHGIHHRWEGSLVDDIVGREGWMPPVEPVARLFDPQGAPWTWLAESYALVPSVLEDDLAATRSTGAMPGRHPRRYWVVFGNLQRATVERQLEQAGKRTAQLILEAWIRAGSPALAPSR